MRADERNHFLHVAARDGFELIARKFGGIARDAPFGAAVGQIRQRAFPTHPHRERGGFPHRKRRREARAAFGGAERKVVLNAIALESLRAAIIHVHRERDRDGALREHEPIAIVGIDLEIIGDDVELIASHAKYVVVINIHRSESGR